MLHDLVSDSRGLLALAGLLLLPGVALPRIAWTAVPFCSAGFWIASWWWLPALGLGRGMALRSALGVFAALALLRFRRPWGSRSRPGPRCS